MRDEEIVAVIVFGLGIGAVVAMWSVYHTKKHATNTARLDVINKALDHPDLDPDVKAEMVRLLEEDHRESRKPFLSQYGGILNVLRSLCLIIGWIVFLFCGLVLLLDIADLMELGSRYMREPLLVFGILGFIAMTLPVAIRELLARSGGSTGTHGDNPGSPP